MRLILAFILIIVTPSLACGLPNLDDETTESVPPTKQFIELIPSDQTPTIQPIEENRTEDNGAASSESNSDSDLEQVDQYRSEQGGYVFKPIPKYELEEFFGMATMIAPDADPDLGPVVMLIGGLNEEETTSEELFNEFLEDAESENVEILDKKDISIDGKSGFLAEMIGDIDGKPVIGRIVVVAVSPSQQFTIFASAPGERWVDIESKFNQLLDSIHFFEPNEIDFTGSPGGSISEDG